MGDLAAAEDSCVTELDRAGQAGDLISQSFCLDLLAELDQRADRTPEAARHLREALEIAIRIGNRLRMIDCLNNCGHLCAVTQRWADAVTMWPRTAPAWKNSGWRISRLRPNAARRRCERPANRWDPNGPVPRRSAART
jgi:hypothetical protein